MLNNQAFARILNTQNTSKIKLLLALSLLGLLACVAYLWLNNQPKVVKTFRSETLQFNDQSTQAFCLASKTEFSFLSQKTTQYPQIERFQQEKNYRQKVKACETDFAYAIAHDEIIESPLYKGDLDAFFKRVSQLEQHLRASPLMLNANKLPKMLATQLGKLPKNYAQITAFDVALVTQRVNDVIAVMPEPEYVLPHQRQMLFHLGAFGSVAQAAANSDQSLAQDKLNQYQSQMNAALVTGDAKLAASALSSLITNISTANTYTDYRGGFSDYDFFMANMQCDTQYATFLSSKKIQPSAGHILHLLSLMGHAQYPEISSGGSQSTFNYADPALGTPSVKALPQCVELAKHYATHVQGFNHPELTFSNGYYQTNVYDEIYKIANDGVFEWWVRDDEKQYHNGRAPNTTVNGDPALLIDAAAEVLKQQPASYEQFCAWANHAHAWTTLVKDSQPNMVSAILNLPQQWKNAPVIYQTPNRACNLSFGITNEYQTASEGLVFLNKVLTQVGIPCTGRAVQEAGAYQLQCQAQAQPWPIPEQTAEYSYNGR
jgi:hypothetical protein